MDFVHEDLSLMSQEMDRWKALHKVKVRQGLLRLRVGVPFTGDLQSFYLSPPCQCEG